MTALGLSKLFLVLALVADFLPSSCEEGKKWEGCWQGNVIPYKILPGFTHKQIGVIKSQLEILHNVTCLRWVEEREVTWHTKDATVWFELAVDKCELEMRRVNDSFTVQVVILNVPCFEGNWIMSCILAPLGFYAEHQRADRDCYVRVSDRADRDYSWWRIVHRDNEDNWVERFPYDKYSVMHYHRGSRLRARSERWYNLWQPLGNYEGELTKLDVWKLLYRFCKYPHFCDVDPLYCKQMDEMEKPCTKVRPPKKNMKS